MNKIGTREGGIMTPTQFAGVCGVSRQCVYNWLRSGKIRAVIAFGKVWCLGNDVEKYLDERVKRIRQEHSEKSEEEIRKVLLKDFESGFKGLRDDIRKNGKVALDMSGADVVKE